MKRRVIQALILVFGLVGFIAAFKGRPLVRMVQGEALFITTFATVVVAVFIVVQVGIEVWRDYDRKRSLREQVVGPAWLARRSLEEDVRSTLTSTSPVGWAAYQDKVRIDRVERQMLEVRELSAKAGGSTLAEGRSAFMAWIAYADRANKLRTAGQESWSEQNRLYREVTTPLVTLIEKLEVIAERHEDEPKRPTLADIRPDFPPLIDPKALAEANEP